MLRSPRLPFLSAAALGFACLALSPFAHGGTPESAGPIELLDAHLHGGRWEAAREAALILIARNRTTPLASGLAPAVARLALAEAGLGKQEDAVWHWHLAQNLDRSVLEGKALTAYGPPGELLARNSLRRADEAPAGWTVLASTDPEVKPGRLLSGPAPKLSAEVAAIAAPKGLKLQAVIDTEGRLHDPVVIGGEVPGVVWEVLEGLRSWRYEPARKGDQPVSVFRSVTINPPAKKPLGELVELSGGLAKVDGLLRAGQWKDARESSQSLWQQSFDLANTGQDQKDLAAVLALRALADAGLGMEDEAVCRWQAAQHLTPNLYDINLSVYGPAGELLEKNRWGEPAGRFDGNPKVEAKPKVLYPKTANPVRLQGGFVMVATVGANGGVRHPIVAWMQGLSMDPKVHVSQSSVNRLLAASALDTVCGWHFRPGNTAGRPAAYQTVVTGFILTSPLGARFIPAADGFAGRGPTDLRIEGLPRKGRDMDPLHPIWGQGPPPP
ncbi:MAG: hypothetical protein QOF89_4020 [Acidobacteriota bacterium]|jgi:hypothetical protein|nr:hypothetical protein [Acidobacteriota bacterium]